MATRNIGTWLYTISDTVLNIISFASPNSFGKWVSSPFVYDENKTQGLGQSQVEKNSRARI